MSYPGGDAQVGSCWYENVQIPNIKSIPYLMRFALKGAFMFAIANAT